jgi:LacI family transcriptional regulator
MARPRGKTGTTIADVAAALDLSTSAVSLALRGKGGVSEATRVRIVRTAEELGYKPAGSPSTRKRKTRTIGLVVRALAQDPHENVFYGPVLAGIEEACRNRSLGLMLGAMELDDLGYPLAFPPIAMDRSCDALIILGGVFSGDIEARLLSTHPAVLVDAYSEGRSISTILIDNVGGAQMATEHLISLGHRDILLLGTDPVAYPGILDRRRGYENAIAAAGLSPHFVDGALRPQHLLAADALAYVRAHPNVTAVFCAFDAIAVVLLQAAAERGISVPEQLSVVGFDDIDLARQMSPTLTTMAVDQIGMGRMAVSLLAHRLEYPTGFPTDTLARTTLVKRESSGPPRR